LKNNKASLTAFIWRCKTTRQLENFGIKNSDCSFSSTNSTYINLKSKPEVKNVEESTRCFNNNLHTIPNFKIDIPRLKKKSTGQLLENMKVLQKKL